jgi:methionyl-tRNA synthetase
MNVARSANKYFNDEEPWKTVKDNIERCRTTIYVSIQITGSLAILMYPFLPFTSEKILKVLNVNNKINSIIWDNILQDKLIPEHTLGESEILFRKIEDSEIEPEIEKLKKINAQIRPEKKEENLIDISVFKKIDLRTATIIHCEKVKGAKKLLKLEVDDGDKKRQIIAGIAQHYEPEEIIGKRIIIVANLKPTTLMGEKSEGMLLAATSGEKLVLLTTDKDIDTGSKIS